VRLWLARLEVPEWEVTALVLERVVRQVELKTGVPIERSS
jgi:hypothetical protein